WNPVARSGWLLAAAARHRTLQSRSRRSSAREREGRRISDLTSTALTPLRRYVEPARAWSHHAPTPHRTGVLNETSVDRPVERRRDRTRLYAHEPRLRRTTPASRGA